MNIFAPFILKEDTASRIHLVDSSVHQIFILLLTRIMPLLLVAGAVFVALNTGNEIPIPLLIIFIACVVGVVIIVLAHKNTRELQLDKIGFTITYQAVIGSKTIQVPYGDVHHIHLQIKRGKVAGHYYSLVLKWGKKLPLFKIPRVYMNFEKERLISEKIKSLSGLFITSNKQSSFV